MSSVSVFKKLLQVCCVVTAATFFFAQPANALDIPKDCSDLEMLQHKWEMQYFRDLKFEKPGRKIPQLTCNSIFYLFAKAIWVIENAKTSPEFEGMYERLKNSVTELVIFQSTTHSNGTACAGSVISDNINQKSKGTIYLYRCAFATTEDEYNLQQSVSWPREKYMKNLFQLVTTIVHELRHIELGPAGVHQACTWNIKSQCDSEFIPNAETANVYSYEILYTRNLMQIVSLNKNERALIEQRISNIFELMFNN